MFRPKRNKYRAKLNKIQQKAENNMAKITIDPTLLDKLAQKDQEAIDEIIAEIDALIGHALTKQDDTKKVDVKPVSTGVFCKRCDNFFDYSEPNQINGTFICYSCRS